MNKNKEDIVILKRSELKHSTASDILKIVYMLKKEGLGYKIKSK